MLNSFKNTAVQLPLKLNPTLFSPTPLLHCLILMEPLSSDDADKNPLGIFLVTTERKIIQSYVHNEDGGDLMEVLPTTMCFFEGLDFINELSDRGRFVTSDATISIEQFLIDRGLHHLAERFVNALDQDICNTLNKAGLSIIAKHYNFAAEAMVMSEQRALRVQGLKDYPILLIPIVTPLGSMTEAHGHPCWMFADFLAEGLSIEESLVDALKLDGKLLRQIKGKRYWEIDDGDDVILDTLSNELAVYRHMALSNLQRTQGA